MALINDILKIYANSNMIMSAINTLQIYYNRYNIKYKQSIPLFLYILILFLCFFIKDFYEFGSFDYGKAVLSLTFKKIIDNSLSDEKTTEEKTKTSIFINNNIFNIDPTQLTLKKALMYTSVVFLFLCICGSVAMVFLEFFKSANKYVLYATIGCHAVSLLMICALYYIFNKEKKNEYWYIFLFVFHLYSLIISIM